MSQSTWTTGVHLTLTSCLTDHAVFLQAYNEMANFLKQQGAMLTSKHKITEPPEDLQEDMRKPIKMLKGLVQGPVISEQAQSLLSFCPSVEDQICTAYEIAREWQPPVLECVSNFYER